MFFLNINTRITTAAARLVWCLMWSMLSAAAADEHMMMHHHHHSIRSDIMGDHTMMPGRCMLTLKSASMNMAGNRNGSRNLSRAEVHQNFVVSPSSMLIQMNMVDFMCGVSNRVTLMGMLPQVRKSMDHQARNGNRFSTRVSGLGDLQLMAVWKLLDKKADGKTQQVHVNIGAAVPTGSIDKKDMTPMGRVRLPYPMQLGSGTLDPLLAVHYTEQREGWAWGVHTRALFRQGRNSNDYRLGHDYRFKLWSGYQLPANVTAWARISGKVWRPIKGRDRRLNPAVVPTARTDLHGGEQAVVSLGLKWMSHSQHFGMNHFSISAGTPFYQHLNGPQLRERFRGHISWTHMF